MNILYAKLLDNKGKQFTLMSSIFKGLKDQNVAMEICFVSSDGNEWDYFQIYSPKNDHKSNGWKYHAFKRLK